MHLASRDEKAVREPNGADRSGQPRPVAEYSYWQPCRAGQLL